MQEPPFDLGPAQETLRRGKELAARRQAKLDDPEGMELVERVAAALQRAVLAGHADDVERLDATLRNLIEKEEALRAKGRISDATEAVLREAIANEQGRRRGPQ